MAMTKRFLAGLALLVTGLVSAREEVQVIHQVQVDADGSTQQEFISSNSSFKCGAAIHNFVSSRSGLLTDNVSLMIHRNGDPEPCGSVTSISLKSIESALQALDICDETALSKYQIESLFTTLLHYELPDSTCGSADNSTAPAGLLGHCDMGPERTTLQPDHDRLVPTSSGSLPCRFYTREGGRVSSFEYFSKLLLEAKAAAAETCSEPAEGHEATCDTSTTASIHLYAVPAGRMFMLAPSFVGEKFVLGHVTDLDEDEKAIVIETISVHPRVFEIYDFFSPTEADELIGKSEKETSATHKLHRSTTGATDGQIFSKRTSENAWDTHGKLAQKIKRRCLSMLGMDEYWESHTDGLQILRYQGEHLQAYTTHADYLDLDTEENYNYNSSNVGGNRFATVLLYMSDLEENAGGETVFESGWPIGLPEDQRLSKLDAIRKLRASPEGALLKKGTWEEEMTALCRSRLSFRPGRGRAALFYSQLPNGTEDKSVLHGGCPVLGGTKWAANLWVWNAARAEYETAPLKRPTDESTSSNPLQLLATFHNTGKDPAYRDAALWFDEAGDFGSLAPGKELSVNTYEGHVWNIKSGDKLLKTIVINDEKEQVYSF